MARFTREQIEEAKHADLYQFLIDNYSDDFLLERGQLRKRDDRSITIKEGMGFFMDWSCNYKGDGMEFLEKFYGYSFLDAVDALLDGYASDKYERVNTHQSRTKDDVDIEEAEEHEIVLPETFIGEPRNLYAYLMKQRAIPKDTIKALIDAGLMYQDIKRNIVFVSYSKKWYEVRGTNTYTKPFKQNGLKGTNRFWYFMTCKNPEKVFITEGAIDAISLYELRDREDGMYVSMHGVGNQKIIDRIKSVGKYHIILAVDNEEHGEECRQRNLDLEHIIPENKDWNQDLQMRAHGRISV